MTRHCTHTNMSHTWKVVGVPAQYSNGSWWWKFRCRYCAKTLSFTSGYAPASCDEREDFVSRARVRARTAAALA